MMGRSANCSKWSNASVRMSVRNSDENFIVSFPPPLRTATWNCSALALSPDGQRIACGSYDGKIHVWELTGVE